MHKFHSMYKYLNQANKLDVVHPDKQKCDYDNMIIHTKRFKLKIMTVYITSVKIRVINSTINFDAWQLWANICEISKLWF